MGTFIGVILIFGFIAFSAYQLIGIVRYYKEKKKSKIQEKGDKKE